MASQTWNTAGTFTWVPPDGVFSADTVETQASSGGGGKGFGGSSTQTLTYTARHTYTYEGVNGDSSPNPGFSPGAKINTDGTAYQGDDQLGDNGNTSTFIVWPASIPSDISGGTITDIKITLNNNHSWFNSGMTYHVGKTTAGVGGSSRPSITDPDLVGGLNTAEGATNTYSLSSQLTAFANALAAGNAFVLYNPSSTRFSYGQFAGASQSGPPKLTIVINFTTTLGGGGSGGGGNSTATGVGVTPGVGYPVYVGAGGLPGGNDQPSTDGQDGDIASFSGDTQTVSATGGGGGSGASNGSPGTAGARGTGTFPGSPGGAGTSAHGGAGGAAGDGDAGAAASTGPGNDGPTAGAGASGGYGSGNDGGFGQDGYVTITWTPPSSFSKSDTDTGHGTDARGSVSTGPTQNMLASATEGGPHGLTVQQIGVRAVAGTPLAARSDLDQLTALESWSVSVSGGSTPSSADTFSGTEAQHIDHPHDADTGSLHDGK